MEQTLNGHTGGVYSVAFNDDGTKVVSGSEDNTIKIWNVATGEMEQTLNGHTGGVFSVAFNDIIVKILRILRAPVISSRIMFSFIFFTIIRSLLKLITYKNN